MGNEKRTQINRSGLIILGIFFLTSGGNAVNSVLQKIIEAFPTVGAATVRMVSTLPNLTGMGIGLIAGATLGKRLRYRTLYLFGVMAFVIGGVGPALFHDSLGLILVFRAIFGMSLGAFSTCNAYVLSTQPVSMQAKVVGWGAVCTNLGAAILQMASGTLADIYWPYAFWPYASGLVVLIFVRRLKEPAQINPELSAKQEVTETKAEKGKLGKRVFLYVGINFFVMITAVPVMTGMSTLVADRGLGDSTTVALILTICQAGGILTGLILGKFVSVLKRFSMPVALFVQGLGIFGCLAGQNLAMICIAALVSGIGTILVSSLSATYCGQSTSKETIALATSVLMISTQCANFLSSYYIVLAQSLFGSMFRTDVECAYFLSSVLYVIVIILTLVFNVSPKPVDQNQFA